jgi:hypothetical protein
MSQIVSEGKFTPEEAHEAACNAAKQLHGTFFTAK